MGDVLVLARLALAAVFAVAGVAKVLDRPGTRQGLLDFDVPERVAGPLTLLLPGAELVTAIALLFAPTARLGALGALVLLGVFVTGLTRALLRGESPDCHCFGQAHSEPASWETVARNVALAVPAAYLAVGGAGPSLVAWADDRDAQHLWLVATSSLAVVAVTTCAVLWRENRRLRSTQLPAAVASIPIGSRAPRFSLPSTGGAPVSLRDLLSGGRPCVLTFVAPGCGPCAAILPEIARWRGALSGRILVTVVSAGEAEVAEKLAAEYGLGEVLVDPGSVVTRAYRVPGTPCAVLVGADGTVRSAPAPGQIAIEALVRLAVRGAPQATPGL